MSILQNFFPTFQRLKNSQVLCFNAKRLASQYSVSRALFGISEEESRRNEEVLEPPPLRIYHCKRHVRGMPRKMNHVAFQIRRLPIDEAITQMKFSPKKAAETIKEVLEEAQQLAVEKYNVKDKSNLWVEQAFVGKGNHIKQIRYHAKGRFGKMKIYFCHFFLILQEGPALGRNIKKKYYQLSEFGKVNRHPLHIQNSLSAF